MNVDDYLQRIMQWANTRDDIRMVILIGSYARPDDHAADAFSDIDLILLSKVIRG